MTEHRALGHTDLPATVDTPYPATRLLSAGRPVARWLIRRRWALETYGTERMPATGPIVVVANHISFIDGPLMAIVSPRPVHALTKVEMFAGKMGTLLCRSGQIQVRRHEADIAAVRASLKVLRDGGVIGVFPEGTRGAGDLKSLEPGAAYLAIASGATVCPVVFLGTRIPGAKSSSVPPRGTRLSMTWGEPLAFNGHGWPRRRAEVTEGTALIRNALLDTLRSAEQATGMTLPGPLPADEIEE